MVLIGDGISDDRAALQAMLIAGAGREVWLPNGIYRLGRGAGYWCVTIPAGTTLRGESRDGVILLQAPGIGPSVRTLQIEGADACVSRLTLDGNRANQTTDEHRAGVFAVGAPRLAIRDVTARGHTGDGFYIYAGSHYAVVTGCLATGNDRDGIVFGGGTVGGLVSGCTFSGNRAQQIDSEPKNGNVVDDVTITDCLLDGAGVSNDYVLTIAGSGAGSRSSGWTVNHCTINGPVQVAWADGVVLASNMGTNPTTKPCVRVYRQCNGVLIDRNVLALSGAAGEVIDITGTSAGQMPSDVWVTRNTLATGAANAHGVAILNATDVAIIDNSLAGSGVAAAYVSGVRAKSTLVDAPIQSIVVSKNRIAGFGSWGVSLAGVAGACILRTDIDENIFEGVGGSMLYALSCDDGAHAARDVYAHGNQLVGNCVTLMAAGPPGALSAAGDRWVVA